MESTNKNTVAEIVMNFPVTAVLFEKLQIDFCCKGKLTLAEACFQNNLDPVIVENLITVVVNESSQKQEDFLKYDNKTLIDMILKKHHSYVINNIPIISGHLYKVVAKHGPKHPFLNQVSELFNKLAIDLEQHMEKEEKVLFPHLIFIEEVYRKGEQDRSVSFFLKGLVGMMENDHQRAGEILEKIRSLTDDFTPSASACNTYKLVYSELESFEKDLHKHVFLENHILFPKGIHMEAEIVCRSQRN